MMFSGLSRHSGMRVYSAGQHLAHELVRRHVGIDHHHLGAVDHDVGDCEVAEAEDVVDVFGLAAFDLAVLGRFLHQPFDLGVGEDFVLRGFLDAEHAQDRARCAVEQPVQRIEDQIGQMERIGDPLRDRHPAARIASVFGTCSPITICSEENTRNPTRNDVKCKARSGHAERDQHRLEQRRNGRLADPAEAERGHGDAELAAGEIGLDVAHHAAAAGARRSGPAPTIALMRKPRLFTSANSAAT